MRLEDHPTVQKVRSRPAEVAVAQSEPLDPAWLRQLVVDAGADDVGFVELDRPEIEDQREHILRAFPLTKTLISIVVRMNREAIRTPVRSIANTEFHHSGDEANDIARHVVELLEKRGIRALNPAMAFPMEMDQFPGRGWVVSHKPVAVAAGLGMMGIHRNLIHEKFGNFVLLNTILLGAELTAYDKPINYNPCLECKLCVAACPVGAISPEGDFNFSSCYTHNYREFMGGFADWTEQVVESKDAQDYRSRVSDGESASLWQSLSYGANYKAAYCLAVCPAGEDVIGPFLADRKAHLKNVLRPLQDKEEVIYVTQNSDAADYVARRFPHKKVKVVGNTLRPNSIQAFLSGVPNVFQPGKSAGLDATYHFTFTGQEQREATIVIKDKKIQVEEGHVGQADLRVTADSQTWVGFLRKETSMPWSLLRRKIRLEGSPKLLLAFGKCFPELGGRQKVVRILPPPSKPFGKANRYRANDAATGGVRWQGRLRLKEIVDEAHGVKTFRFTSPSGGAVPFTHLPGQYLTLHPTPDGVPAKRYYTIASAPGLSERVEITVKREATGLVSQWLHDTAKVGDLLEVEAPHGAFTFTGSESERVVLIGGGVGITPLMSALRHLDEMSWKGKIYLILSFRTPREFIFREEIAALEAANPNLRVTITMSNPKGQPWSGLVGRIGRDLLRDTVPDLTHQRVHVCGPTSMMDAVKADLLALGVPQEQIKMEAFGAGSRRPRGLDAVSKPVAGQVVFSTSTVSAPVQVDMTLLEAAEEASVPIASECRMGTCGSCRVKLVRGQVAMEVDEGLTEQDRAEGYVLACQATVLGDVEIEA